MTAGSIHLRAGDIWDAAVALTATEGSAAEPWRAALTQPGAGVRDLADAAHALCLLHGGRPGVLDHALTHGGGEPGSWLAEAATAFGAERARLVRLVAGIGPVPSTPGQAETETAIGGQHAALAVLAASDRAGVALGAAAAFVLDWVAIAAALDAVAERAGEPVEAAPAIDVAGARAAIAAAASGRPAFARAFLFGASQLLAQHRALWQLLEVRAHARER